MPTISQEAVLALINSAYECALTPERWPRFLGRLAGVLKCATTQIASHDFLRAGGGISAAFRMDPYFVRQYDAHFSKVNVFFRRPSEAAGVGHVYTGQMLCGDHELEASEYYNDFFRRFDVYHALGGTLREANQGIAVVSCLRSRRDGAFGNEETRALQQLVPHLRRVIHIDSAIRAIELSAAASGNVLECLGIGCIVLDRSGGCLLVNEVARRIASAVDGLAISRRGVRAATAAQTAALRGIVERTFRSLDGTDLNSGGALRLSRPSGRRPLEILVSPLRWAAGFPAVEAVAIFVRDPEIGRNLDLEPLRQRYLLAPAELAIARDLVSGRSLADIAEERGAKIATVRWQVKRLLAKTGTKRQSDLVRLANRLLRPSR